VQRPTRTAASSAASAAGGGDDPAGGQQKFGEAAAIFREIGMPFYLAVAQLEQAEVLATSGRAVEAQPLLAEARETFEQLRATPWLERLDALDVGAMTAA
jgi:hypothetical protein